jgi:tetratricopeptide (TPR) repeat protein
MFSSIDPFVGREQECLRLFQSMRECQNGSCSLVLITGPPGIGKSALAREFTARAEQDGMPVAHCSYGADSVMDPYAPFLEALAQLAPERAQKLNIWRQQALSSVVDLPWNDVEQQHFVLQESRESWESQLVEAFILTARRQPVIVDVEDLYLATETAWRFLSRLLQAATQEPLMVLSTLRLQEKPNAQQEALPFYATVIRDLARHGLVTRVRLPRLADDEVEQIIRSYFARTRLSDPCLDHLRAVSEGNPGRLYDEIDRLVRWNVLRQEGGVWVDDAAFFQANHNRGDEDFARTSSVSPTVEVNAVVGKKMSVEFRDKEHPEKALPLLHRLAENCLWTFAFTEARRYYRQAHQILVETGRLRSADHVRVDLRLGWLERLHGEAREALSLAQDLLLAETASEAGLDESTILLHQALALQRLDDHEAALAQLRGCVQVGGRLTSFSRALIFLEIGVAEFAGDQHLEAKRAFLKALELAKTAGSEPLQVRVLRDLGAVEMSLSEPLKAIGYFGQCVGMLRRLGDKRRLAHVYFLLGLNQAEVNDWGAANRSLGRALALSDHLGLHSLKADAYFKRALVLLELGRFTEARDHARKASQILLERWDVPSSPRNPVEIYLETAAVRQPTSEWQPEDATGNQGDPTVPLTVDTLPDFKLNAYRQQIRQQVFC